MPPKDLNPKDIDARIQRRPEGESAEEVYGRAEQGVTPVDQPPVDQTPVDQNQTTPVEGTPVPEQTASLEDLSQPVVQSGVGGQVENIPQTTVAESERIAEAGGQVVYPTVDPTPAAVPGEKSIEGGQATDELWTTAAPIVEKAEEIKGPGFKENALAMLGFLLPVVGAPLSQPLREAQAAYNKKTTKDAELTKLFLGELKDDPASAKRLSRVPRFRDALQRELGMSGEEIQELDESIKQSSQFDFGTFVDLLKTGKYTTDRPIETPYGKAVPKKEFKATKEGYYVYDPMTDKMVVNHNYVAEQQDRIYERAKKSGMSDLEATVMSFAATKGEPVYTQNHIGNGVVSLVNKFTGRVDKIKFADAVKEKVKMEIAKDVAGVPTAMFFYKEGQMPTSIDDITVIPFATIDYGGQSLRDIIMGLPPEKLKEPNFIQKFISNYFGGVEVTDHTTLGDTNQRIQANQQRRPSVPQQQVKPVEEAPVQTGGVGGETQKGYDFLSEATGE